jgi:hypothetical protein
MNSMEWGDNLKGGTRNMFYSTRYVMWLLVIGIIAVVVYERYDAEILNFGRNLAASLKALIPLPR